MLKENNNNLMKDMLVSEKKGLLTPIFYMHATQLFAVGYYLFYEFISI